MTADEFIELASKLYASGRRDPATMRTATSRAYYGAFHLAELTLRNCGIVLSDAKHDRHLYLRGSGHPAAVQAGNGLLVLRGRRVDADYRLKLSDCESPAAVKLCIETAVEIQSLLRQCDLPDTRAQIKTGVEAYLRKVGGL